MSFLSLFFNETWLNFCDYFITALRYGPRSEAVTNQSSSPKPSHVVYGPVTVRAAWLFLFLFAHYGHSFSDTLHHTMIGRINWVLELHHHCWFSCALLRLRAPASPSMIHLETKELLYIIIPFFLVISFILFSGAHYVAFIMTIILTLLMPIVYMFVHSAKFDEYWLKRLESLPPEVQMH